MNLLATAVILAAEEEASGTDLLIPEISELIAGVIAFSIVFFVVWKFAVPAINQTLENRRQAIKAELDEAEKSKVEAASLLEDYKAQLKGARAEADRIVEEARQAADAMKADILAKANADAQEIVAKARAEADTEKDRALQEARVRHGHSVARPRREGRRRQPGPQRPAQPRRRLPRRLGRDVVAVSESDRIKGYAAGLLEIARGEGELDRVERELYQVARAVEGSEELRGTLSDVLIPMERKRGIVDDLIGGRAADLTIAAIDFIVASGRAKDLPEIADELARAAAATRSREVAEIRSAVELDDETVRRLEAALGRATGKQIEVKVVVDPSVVGGIVARVGDTVIDGSVRRRLETLRHALRAG